MTTQTAKNDPTWVEYLIVYLVLGIAGYMVYSSVLSPKGYTISAGWAVLRGQKKPAIQEKESSTTAPQKATAEMKPEPNPEAPTYPTPPVMSPPMQAPMPAPRPAKPRQEVLSEDDD